MKIETLTGSRGVTMDKERREPFMADLFGDQTTELSRPGVDCRITEKAWKVTKDPATGRYQLLREVLITKVLQDYYKEDYNCLCEADAMAAYLNRERRRSLDAIDGAVAPD